jgi:hypothetical protein
MAIRNTHTHSTDKPHGSGALGPADDAAAPGKGATERAHEPRARGAPQKSRRAAGEARVEAQMRRRAEELRALLRDLE